MLGRLFEQFQAAAGALPHLFRPSPPLNAGRHAAARHLLALALLLSGMALSTQPAQAVDFRNDNVVTVPSGTTVDDDLFAAGQSVTIAGQVNGDAYAFGQTVALSGTVERDLIAAGQQITIDGVVKGNLRVAGQQVVINGRVEGNVTAGSQVLSLGRQGRVEGSIVTGTQDLNLLGPVGRGVTVGAQTVHLAGTVGGNVQAEAATLTIDPPARIGGRLDYASPREASIPSEAVAGGVQFRQVEREERRDERRERGLGGLFTFFNLAWLVGSVIAGVLLVRLLPGLASQSAADLRAHPLASFGVGALALVAVPFAALLVAFTIIGLPLSFLAGLGYLLALYLGQLVLGLAVGGVLVELVRRRGGAPRVRAEWLIVLGLVVLYVLTHLPWIGGLMTFVALSLGLGALLRLLTSRWTRRAQPLVPATAS